MLIIYNHLSLLLLQASTRTDERKRNSLARTHREEQEQSHCSHKPCALFPGSVSNPWAAFGRDSIPAGSSQLISAASWIRKWDVWVQNFGTLPFVWDCTTNTCVGREVPRLSHGAATAPPQLLGCLCLLLGCAVLALGSGCFPGWQLCAGGELPLSFP